MVNIDELTIGQAKGLIAAFGALPVCKAEAAGIQHGVGRYVIVRTFSAGVWAGILAQKSGTEVVLEEARRLWKWRAAHGISLSECATVGIDHGGSRVPAPVASVWLEAIEIIPCTDVARISIAGAPNAKA